METAAVLYRDPGLKVDWNQIHLCELDAGGFKGSDRSSMPHSGRFRPTAAFGRLRRP